MADLILVTDAQAWAEGTKLTIDALDAALLAQVQTQITSRLAGLADVSLWVGPGATPEIVKTIISMFYVAWLYDRQYSEDQEEGNDYAALLRAQAESLMLGLLDGSIDLPGGNPTAPTDSPAFFPTDASSGMESTFLNPELGPASFHMGRGF